MLDYPSACWHRPASPWTHNPAEKQPSANGVFYGRLFSAYTVQSDITPTCAFSSARLSGIFSRVLHRRVAGPNGLCCLSLFCATVFPQSARTNTAARSFQHSRLRAGGLSSRWVFSVATWLRSLCLNDIISQTVLGRRGFLKDRSKC